MKNNFRFRILTTMLMLLCMISLTGCQLAISSKDASADALLNSDKLCGVFVTTGDQSLISKVETLKDSDFSIDASGQISINNTTHSTLQGNRMEGKLNKEKKIVVFDGLDGFYMGCLRAQDDNGEYYNSLMCDPSLTDVKYAINVTDNSEVQQGEATLYVGKNFHDAFYLNPVYLTEDGSYYTILGNAQGTSFSGDLGTTCSQTIDSAVTTNINDSSKTEQSSYKINVVVVDVVRKIVIKEMNNKDELIKTMEYLPTSPDEYTVDKMTSYVIVEEIMDRSDKTSGVKRSIYSPLPRSSTETSNQHRCNFPGDKGIIAQKLIKFIYE